MNVLEMDIMSDRPYHQVIIPSLHCSQSCTLDTLEAFMLRVFALITWPRATRVVFYSLRWMRQTILISNKTHITLPNPATHRMQAVQRIQ